MGMRAKISLGALARAAVLLGATGLALVSPTTGAKAQFWLFNGPVWHGNDTGGIIPWSCENEAVAHQAAAGFCARFNKYARITGVGRQYGDYISFNCLWAPDVDRFAKPPEATRSVCRGEPRLLTK
jgi:hypothetical protein